MASEEALGSRTHEWWKDGDRYTLRGREMAHQSRER